MPPPTKHETIPADERGNFSPEELKAIEAKYAAMPVYKPLPPGLVISPAEVEVTNGENRFEFTLTRAKM